MKKAWHNLQTRVISAVYTQLHLCSQKKLLEERCEFKNSFIFINAFFFFFFNCWVEVVFITKNSQGFSCAQFNLLNTAPFSCVFFLLIVFCFSFQIHLVWVPIHSANCPFFDSFISYKKTPFSYLFSSHKGSGNILQVLLITQCESWNVKFILQNIKRKAGRIFFYI